MNLRTLLTSLSILAAIAVTTSGCGRKGDPIRPSLAASQETGTNVPAPQPAPDRRIILDSLLD